MSLYHSNIMQVFKFPQCSGYHVRLTRERSPVRARAETCFYFSRIFQQTSNLSSVWYVLSSSYVWRALVCEKLLCFIALYFVYAQSSIAMYHSDFLTTPSNYSCDPIPEFLTNSGSCGRKLPRIWLFWNKDEGED